MTCDVLIRRAGKTDAPGIASLLREAFADFEPAYTKAAYAATTPGVAEIERRIAEGPTWVAERQDRIIGTISAVRRPEGVYLRSMAVAPSDRGCGSGRMLLRAAEYFAESTGATRVFLSTTPFLMAAIRLYDAAGFVRSNAPPHDLLGTPLVTMEKTVARNVRIHPLMHVPVPWVFILTFVAGAGLQHLAPLTIRSANAILIGRVAGIALTVAGAVLAFAGLGIFKRARTTTVPFETPSRLITNGPYRFTRNPMYVGLTLTYLGVAALQMQLWPVLLLPLLSIYVDRVVIPVEEASLRDVFGDAYQHYCARVRRWI